MWLQRQVRASLAESLLLIEIPLHSILDLGHSNEAGLRLVELGLLGLHPKSRLPIGCLLDRTGLNNSFWKGLLFEGG